MTTVVTSTPLSSSREGPLLPPAHPAYTRLKNTWMTSPNAASIRFRDCIQSHLSPLHINFDNLVELLGEAQHDPSNFGRWVYEQGAEILGSVQPDSSFIDNNEWSHAASYLFRAACFCPTPLRSILDHPESHPSAASLISKAVSFCELSNSLGTFPVILRGILASNLRAWSKDLTIDSFYFRPSALCAERFNKLLAHAREVEEAKQRSRSVPLVPLSENRPTVTAPHALIEKFCNAATPANLLQWAFDRNVAMPIPDVAAQVRRKLDNCGSATAPLSQRKEPLSITAAPPPGSLQERPGLFIDVFGTLIGHDGTPNFRLLQLIDDVMKNPTGCSVFLISDSDEEDLSRALAILGNLKLPPVLHKEDLLECELEWLVDNCEPEPQGLHARCFLQPSEALAQGVTLFNTTR